MKKFVFKNLLLLLIPLCLSSCSLVDSEHEVPPELKSYNLDECKKYWPEANWYFRGELLSYYCSYISFDTLSIQQAEEYFGKPDIASITYDNKDKTKFLNTYEYVVSGSFDNSSANETKLSLVENVFTLIFNEENVLISHAITKKSCYILSFCENLPILNKNDLYDYYIQNYSIEIFVPFSSSTQNLSLYLNNVEKNNKKIVDNKIIFRFQMPNENIILDLK